MEKNRLIRDDCDIGLPKEVMLKAFNDAIPVLDVNFTCTILTGTRGTIKVKPRNRKVKVMVSRKSKWKSKFRKQTWLERQEISMLKDFANFELDMWMKGGRFVEK